MLFNSLDFLLFFPIVTALYFLLAHKWRWLLLLVASCIFYMDWIPAYILILFLIIGIDYIAARQIEKSSGKRRKLFLLASFVGNLGLLCLFKYFNFFAENVDIVARSLGISYAAPVLNLILPIGLSFHTFQALAYTIEVYRGNQPAERHLGIYSLYVMFYPQLVAGPIERPQNLIHQLKEEKAFDYASFTSGLQLMLWGFFKKLVIADRLGILVAQVYGDPFNYSGLPLLFATYCFAYQIYCDFSGYTDIAIGAAQVMGIKLMKNFNCPYSARNPQEFWQRWHISLSTWFRDYLYIPLGGSRHGHWNQYRNILIVFLLSGLWHGANWTFAIWGFIHGAYLAAYVALRKVLGVLNPTNNTVLAKLINLCGWITTFNLVCFAWIFFRANSLSDAAYIVMHLFSPTNSRIVELGLRVSDFLIAGAAIFILELVQFVQRRTSVRQLVATQPLIIRWPVYYAAILTVLVFGKFTSQQFIYFQF